MEEKELKSKSLSEKLANAEVIALAEFEETSFEEKAKEGIAKSQKLADKGMFSFGSKRHIPDQMFTRPFELIR
ncbi:MAG: hypothetical protein IPP04_06805 [Saprospiraceae bacterium]|nr:hypothetical protein [Saprospiraceae bacterium]